MKNTLTLLVFLLTPFYSFSQTAVNTVDWSQLEERDDIRYKTGSETPYSGAVVSFNSNGQKKLAGNFVNGKEEGLFTEWYQNGQKISEVKYVNGEPEGLETRWHRNGQKQSEINYINGKKEGLETRWNKNGKKHREINHVNGKEVSKKEWHKDVNEIKN
jgi:antitoxin component YwqK of YwqJK toxin-antitoxin module